MLLYFAPVITLFGFFMWRSRNPFMSYKGFQLMFAFAVITLAMWGVTFISYYNAQPQQYKITPGHYYIQR